MGDLKNTLLNNSITVTLKYWFFVIAIPSLRASLDIKEIGSKVFGIILQGMSAILLVTYFGFSVQIPNTGYNISSAVLVMFVFVVLRIVSNIIYLPATRHRDQEDVIERLKQQTQSLKDNAKPRLELYFDPTHKSSKQIDHADHGSYGTTLRVFVRNVGTSNVEQISAKIEKIIPSDAFTFLPAELGIMNNQENRLNAGDTLCLDVISVSIFYDQEGTLQYRLHFGFANQVLKRRSVSKELLPYEFAIAVSGINSPKVQKTFEFVVNEANDDRSFELREKDIEPVTK